MIRKLILSTVATLSLAACASQPGTPTNATATPAGVSGLVTKLQTVTTTDLSDAEADAVAHNDAIAAPCYPALGTWVQSLSVPAAKKPAGAGIFYAEQVARDTAQASSSITVPTSVKLACAALMIDDATFLAKADAFLAAAVATGGASVPAALGLAPTLPLAITPAGVTVTAPAVVP